LLFPGIERRLGIADLLASCLHDERDPASTTHSYADMIRARIRAYPTCWAVSVRILSSPLMIVLSSIWAF